MNTNEKATAVLPDETIADINTQDNDTTESKRISNEILAELVTMQRRFAEIYKSTGLIYFNDKKICFTDEAFLATFSEYETNPWDCDGSVYTHELSTDLFGIKVSCLISREV